MPTQLCARCGKHPATFRYHGKVRRDRQHDLCQQCFRALENHRRVEAMSDASEVEGHAESGGNRDAPS